MQKTLLLFILAVFFTGCIERGQNLKPAPVHTQKTVIKKIPVVSKVESQKVEASKEVTAMPTQTLKKKELEEIKEIKEIKIEKNIDPVVTEVVPTPTKEENNFFILSDETKNRISGFFIIVIGIMILI